MAEALVDRYSWRIVVVTSGQYWGRLRREDRGDLRIYRLPYHIRVSNTRFGITWCRHVRSILAAEKPDLINAHAPVPGLADLTAKLAGSTPFVLKYHGGSMRKGRWPVDLFIGFYERVLRRPMLSRAAWIICSSDFVRDSHLVTDRRPECSNKSANISSGNNRSRSRCKKR